MRKAPRQIIFSFLVLISCTSNQSTSLNNFVDLYGGRFTLDHETTNARQAKTQNFIKLTSSKNDLIEDGWLLPAAMANNCAIMLYLSNNRIVKTKELLEVEIQAKGMEPFSFKYKVKELDSLVGDYPLVDTVIKEFIASAKSNNISKAKSIGYNIINQQEQGFLSFMGEFQEAIPSAYKTSQIVGFMIVKDTNSVEYLVDVILISHYNERKWINVSLIKINEQIKIKEIKF